MTGKALDYSQARPPLGKVKANGYSCVYRYVCSDTAEAGLPGKRLTPAERDQILNAGLDIGLHGEDNASAAQSGYARGKQQGQQWADYASTVLHAPRGMTIVAAVDYDTNGTYPQVVADYLHGVTDGLAGEYQTGVYGSIYVVDAALALKHAVHGVQTVAWSHGKVSSWAHLYQHGGSEFQGTDYNDILHTPHGSWLQTLGGDMPLTDAEIQAVADRVWAKTVNNGSAGAADGVAGRRLSYIDERVAGLSSQISQQAHDTQDDIAALAAQVTELARAVAAIPTGGPVAFDMTGSLTPKPTP